MFWAVCLLLLLTSLYALFLEDSSVSFLLDTRNETSEELKAVRENLHSNWNGMGAAVVSLVYSISGGASWGDLAFPFWAFGSGCGLSYMAYVILTVFGLLNVLIGIFVQEAEELSKWDQDFVTDIADYIKKKKKKDKQIARLFSRLDKDKSGEVSLRELSLSLQEETVRSKFRDLDLNTEKMDILLKVIDVDGNGLITRDEFTNGITKLGSKANATEMAHLLLEEQNMDSKIDDICQRIDKLHHRFDAIACHR
jgi:Ca2+-binding EF-hand superfamily protein